MSQTTYQRDGACDVFVRSAGGQFLLRRDQYPIVREAFLAGKPFVEAVGLHGEAMVIKLAEVCGIIETTPEVVAARAVDRRESNRQDRAESMLDGEP